MTLKQMWPVVVTLVLAVHPAWADAPPARSGARCCPDETACSEKGCPAQAACPRCPQCPSGGGFSYQFSRTYTIPVDCPQCCPPTAGECYHAAVGVPDVAWIPVGLTPVPMPYVRFTESVAAPAPCASPCPAPAACPACPAQHQPVLKQYLVEAKLVDASAKRTANEVTVHMVAVEGQAAKIRLDRHMIDSAADGKWLEVTVKDFSCEGKPVEVIERNPNRRPHEVVRMPDGTVGVMPPPRPIMAPACAAAPVAPPPPALCPPAPPIETAKRPDGVRPVVARPVAVPPPAPPVALAVMPPPAPGVCCSMAVFAEPMGPPSVIRIASDKGKDRLEIRNGSAARLTAEHLNLQVPGCDDLKVSADHQQVVLSCRHLKATADQVTTDHQGQLILQGHVQLSYHKDAQSVHKVSADRAVLRLNDGHLHFEVSLK